MFKPNTVTDFSTLNDRAHSTASDPTTAAVTQIAFRREKLRSSMRNVIKISLSEMVDVSDAKNSSTKNRMAQTYPPAICWNTAGSTSNTSLGPASGCMPNENTAGKMTMPAKMATSVSSEAMTTASRVSDVSSLK